jgi:hypothetical protein
VVIVRNLPKAGDIVSSCPYGAIMERSRATSQNWFFDAHLLDGGWKRAA